jgi:ATP-dependent helicase/nuclease subunit A
MADPMSPATASDARRITQEAQFAASDPLASAWVAANAGTGKTYVLVMRVLRLLLAGTAPDRILCLTYTKAAAAEMSNRLFAQLAHWTTAPPATLAQVLHKLLQTEPDAATIERARTLFAQAIETPGGLKVQTIHAFCERLLKRFPLEAGVAAGFEVLDEATEAELRRAAIDAVLARANNDAALAGALDVVVRHTTGDHLDQVLRAAIAKPAWLAELVSQAGSDAAIRLQLRRRLGVRLVGDEADVLADLNACIDAQLARAACDLLADGKDSDRHGQTRLAPALRPELDLAGRVRILEHFFLTAKAEPRKRLVTKDLAASQPALAQRLVEAQQRFCTLQAERLALTVANASAALVLLADAVQQELTSAKTRRGALTFQDLIAATARLLAEAPEAQWVLYKLDGGLDHILVDEAQDTAPQQWQVVTGLAGEFFAGASASETIRTLFAVGDEKQSIYSFQDAKPRLFAEKGDAFGRLARQAGQTFHRVPLTLSFRSTDAVLASVDAIFAAPAARRGLTADTNVIAHMTDRIGQAGLVERWPLQQAGTVVPEAPFALTASPATASTELPPLRRLANRVADRIQRMLVDQELLAAQGRPIRAGDILVLLRKRRPLGPAIIRALEQRGVPVAGADRVRVTEEIGVEDLMALARVLLLPEDDLALACVLKSPLFDFDEANLFSLAHDRKGSLWSALLAAAETAPLHYGPAANQLKRWRSEADFLPPFEFLSAVLDRDGGRKKLLRRLGPEAADTIDELLNLALSHDAREPPSLQGFLAWLERANSEVKRDMDQGRNEVRVMTVHAAKGLEAPIVFLPDTCGRAEMVRAPLLALVDPDAAPSVAEPMVWLIKGAAKVDAVAEAAASAKQDAEDEHRRLLYVALTRPRDRLYIAGYETANGRIEAGCWYEWIEAGLADRMQKVDESEGPVFRMTTAQIAPVVTASALVTAEVSDPAPYPEWATRSARKEPQRAIPLAPSRLAPLESEEGTGVTPPDGAGKATGAGSVGLSGPNRFRRGLLTHALLQHLPGMAAGDQRAAAERYLQASAPDLSPAQRDAIASEVLAVLQTPDFAALFGPDSLAEVPIAALLPAQQGPPLRVTGQIDRLHVTEQVVTIVDYKANRSAPDRIDAVPPAYVLQLAAYRLVLARVYPGRPIRAALLWTETPRLMPLPGDLLDRAALDVLAGRS